LLCDAICAPLFRYYFVICSCERKRRTVRYLFRLPSTDARDADNSFPVRRYAPLSLASYGVLSCLSNLMGVRTSLLYRHVGLYPPDSMYLYRSKPDTLRLPSSCYKRLNRPLITEVCTHYPTGERLGARSSLPAYFVPFFVIFYDT